MSGDMPFFLVDRCKKTESSIREVTSADEPFEKAAAPSTNSAAAQLDHFSLREKLGLEQCSQKAPSLLTPLSAT
jgi:hypothetical protein